MSLNYNVGTAITWSDNTKMSYDIVITDNGSNN